MNKMSLEYIRKMAENETTMEDFISWIRAQQKFLQTNPYGAHDFILPSKFLPFVDANVTERTKLPIYFVNKRTVSIGKTFYDLHEHESARW